MQNRGQPTRHPVQAYGLVQSDSFHPPGVAPNYSQFQAGPGQMYQQQFFVGQPFVPPPRPGAWTVVGQNAHRAPPAGSHFPNYGCVPRPAQNYVLPPVGQPTAPPHFSGVSENIELVERQVKLELEKGKADEGRGLVSVLQAALSVVGVLSLESLGLTMEQIPSLNRLIRVEVKVHTLIECHLATRKVTTLHDLERDIVGEEGVKNFEDLGLGPLLRHPSVIKHFSPPDSRKPFRITTADVIHSLMSYMDKVEAKEVQVEKFLSSLAEQKKCKSPQELGVLIQNIGMYVQAIRQAKRTEQDLIIKFRAHARVKSQVKQESSVMARVEEFLKRNENIPVATKDAGLDSAPVMEGNRSDGLCSPGRTERDQKLNAGNSAVEVTGSTIHQDSDSDSATTVARKDGSFQNKLVSKEKRPKKRKLVEMHVSHSVPSSACPYPSAAEERSRIEAARSMMLSARKKRKSSSLKGLSLSDSAIAEFVQTLKDVCSEEETMLEVVNALLAKYDNHLSVNSFLKYPLIGLLNLAIGTVKSGFWDDVTSRCSSLKTRNEDGGNVSTLKSAVHTVEQGGPSAEDLLATIVNDFDEFFSHQNLGKISESFGVQEDTELLSNCWARVIWISECCKRLEATFAARYSASFCPIWLCKFLHSHWHLLPRKVTERLVTGPERKSQLLVKVPKHRLVAFVKQSLLAGGHAEENFIKQLPYQLHQQFNFVNCEDLGHVLAEDLTKCAKDLADASVGSVLFSSALFPRISGLDLSVQKKPLELPEPDLDLRVGLLGHVNDNDALRCLQSAPYLCDLYLWSNWDLVYAPSLGPLLDWIETGAGHGKLYVLLTSRGSILRIDKSASVDGFLTSIYQNSGRQVAETLVSLFVLYGGTYHVPRVLLQSYATKGLLLLVQDLMSRYPKSLDEKPCAYETCPSSLGVTAPKNLLSDAASCVLDCLQHVPTELRVLVAEIFLPSMKELGMEAPSLLLRACRCDEHRTILHGIGLALGILEWINDFQMLIASSSSSEGFTANVADQAETASKVGEVVSLDSLAVGDDLPDQTTMLGAVPAVVMTGEVGKSSSPDQEYYNKAQLIECSTAIIEDPATSKEGKSSVLHPNSQRICNSSREVVESIRRDEFGLGQQLNMTEHNLLVKQHERMGRALNRLSRDLYSEDSHFVLELIQNADDNVYETGVDATLVFVLQQGHITVLNNEVGFTEANMRAICDVGNSTKAGKAGYIGQKGIGFKSVFRVTDAPEIHSNGFHVKFDVSEGDIGFILPTIIIPPVSSVSLAADIDGLSESGWRTQINLPLNQAFQACEPMLKLATKFDDVHPSLLIFLQKLRCIAVENKLTGSICILRRQDLNDKLVRVVHDKGSMTWLVVRQQLEVAISRPGISSTEIVLGFPVQEVSAGGYDPQYRKQRVFAFLPLRGYGFRFIIQADFILTSSREDVDRDNAWNQWLCSEIPALFVNAADSFKQMAPSKSRGQAITSYLGFVPLEGEALGLFSPIPRLILARLRGTSWLPVDGAANCALPCLLLRGWTDSVRSLLADDMLKEHLGLHYLDMDVQISDSLATSLGVQMYGSQTLLSVMASVSKKSGALDALGLSWIRRWLIMLSDRLLFERQGKWNQESCCMRALADIPFVPLSDGSFTSLSKGRVWLTGGDEADDLLNSFPLLLAELRTVHPAVMMPTASEEKVEKDGMLVGSDSDAENIRRLFLMLGVCQVSYHEIIKTHILTALRDTERLKSSQSLSVQYMAFIMLHLQSDCVLCKLDNYDIKSQTKEGGLILTNHGLKLVGSEPIHFSRIMGNSIDVHAFLQGTDVIWNEVDSAYLNLNIRYHSKKLGVMQWRTFFKDLGVTDFIQLRPMDELPREDRAMSRDKVSGQDWGSPELLTILEALCRSDKDRTGADTSLHHKQLGAFVRELDRQWDEIFKQCSWPTHASTPSDKAERGYENCFFSLLRAFPCLKSSLTGKLQLPTSLFERCAAVESILGCNAPYALPQITSQGFKDALGLRTQVNVDDALALLQQWRLSTAPFVASISQMQQFYSLLSQTTGVQEEAVTLAMRGHPSIYVPLKLCDGPDQAAPGCFHLGKDTCWEDHTGAMEALSVAQKSASKGELVHVCLKALYPKLRSFFVDRCHVRENPDFDKYVDILLRIASSHSPYEMQNPITAVFKAMSHEVESGAVGSSELLRWKARFQDVNCRVFPTIEGNWVSLNACEGFICLSDDVKLREELRTATKGVHFLLLADDSVCEKGLQADERTGMKEVLSFIRALGIPILSEAVERDIRAQGLKDASQLRHTVFCCLPYLQRYLRKHFREEYAQLQRGDVMSRLRELKCVVVDQLHFRHVLRGLNWWSTPRNCSCLLEGSTLYVKATHAEDFCPIFVELSRFFLCRRADLQLANFLQIIIFLVQSKTSGVDIEHFVVSVQGIPPLGEGELPWAPYLERDLRMRLESVPPQELSSLSRHLVESFGRRRVLEEGEFVNESSEKNGIQASQELFGVEGRREFGCIEGQAMEQRQAAFPMPCLMQLRPPFVAADKNNQRMGTALCTPQTGQRPPMDPWPEDSGEVEECVLRGDGRVILHEKKLRRFHAPNEQVQELTGRSGEAFVFNHLVQKHGAGNVKWVNEAAESGAAFDLIVQMVDGHKEFVEVKATRSVDKDWFEISVREWEFAQQQGENYTIIRVQLGPQAKLLRLPNPVKLCQNKALQLALILPNGAAAQPL